MRNPNRIRFRCYLGVAATLVAAAAHGAAPNAPDAAVLSTLVSKGTPAEAPRVQHDAARRITFLGAPPNAGFHVPGKQLDDAIAQSFLDTHRDAFGFAPGSSLKRAATWRTLTHTAVRFDQQYCGISVFGAAVCVQVGVEGWVHAVLNDTLARPPKGGCAPKLLPNAAAALAEVQAAMLHPGWTGSAMLEPELVIFAPSLLDLPGDTRLAWMVTVRGEEDASYCDRILIDALDGRFLFQVPLSHDALDRAIFDAQNQATDPGTLARAEADPPSGLTDADDAYDFLGDAYTFFSEQHGRDSVDDLGLPLSATVRFCPETCPWRNAQWNGDAARMYFGLGYAAADDVVAHEYTHGVTQNTSGLFYAAQSGALNESFSDIWGEFIDLTNGTGNDTESVRWKMGEDLAGGALRDMRTPSVGNDPDSTCSPLYYTGGGDNGGVHINSGVPNKLAYLLTDGDTFNGETVFPMGIPTVAALFYDVQTSFLNPMSNFNDLYLGLVQAAINLGLSDAERANVEAAARAVAITPETTCRTSPANDACIDAIPLDLDVPAQGNNHTASGELNLNCTGDPLDDFPDVWYSFTPAIRGTYRVSLCDGTDFDATLALYAGTCADTELLACDDDGCGDMGGPSIVEVALERDAYYLIRVSGWAGSTGNFGVVVTRLTSDTAIEGEEAAHSADVDASGTITLTELLRVVQFYNFQALHCAQPQASSEDGYLPGPGDQSCAAHDADYNPTDWNISLGELLRTIQFYNTGSYFPCPDLVPATEDGYCPG